MSAETISAFPYSLEMLSSLGCTGWGTHQQLEASTNDLVVYSGVGHGFCLQESVPCDSSSFGNDDV